MKKGLGIAMALLVLLGCCGTWIAHAQTESSSPQASVPTGRRRLARLVSGNLGRLLMLRSELDIGEEQRGQVQRVIQEHRAVLAEHAQRLVKQRRALRDAVLSQPGEEAAIRQHASELGEAMGDAAVTMARVAADVRAVLTPDQQGRIQATRKAIDESVDSFLREATQPAS